MTLKKWHLWATLIIIWGFFMLWEYDIQTMSPRVKEELVRYDLIFLPIFLLISTFIVCHVTRDKK